jgi:glycine oxidase
LILINRKKYDIIIVGAGIAGLSTAYAASIAGFKTAVIDLNDPGSGASGTPMALLNPATGRKAKKTWKAEKCLNYTKQLLSSASNYTREKIYIENGVIRPALNPEIAEQMFDTFKNSTWEEGWVKWLDDGEISSGFPGLKGNGGGLWIPKGITVNMKGFIRALTQYLESRGVRFYLNTQYEKKSTTSYQINSPSELLESGLIIHCTGMGMTTDPTWNSLPLHRVKGQTLTIELSSTPKFKSSVSSIGYIAQSTINRNSIVLGSTYEHHFNHLEPDSDGAAYLINRMGKTMPEIHQNIITHTGWSGVRVTVPDKKPVAGGHPEFDNLYTLCALGSKGLMLGPILGKLLIDQIKGIGAVPELFSIRRLLGET